MSLLYVDSFDHYNTAQATRKWSTFTHTIGAGGRFGSGMVYGGGNARAEVVLAPTGATLVVGFAMLLSSLPNTEVMYVYSAGALVGRMILSQAVAGVLTWRKGSGATVLVNGIAAPLKQGVWNYIELKVVLSATVGTATIKVNGQVAGTFAGNTQGDAGTNVWDTVGFGGDPLSPAPSPSILDDLVICDGAGAVNNDFLGDVRVQALLPTGPGNYTEFTTLVGAATQWQATAENPADDDTSYIASATAGQRSTFATGDLASAAGAIRGLVIQTEARKDDAGVRTVAGMARSAAVDAAGAGASVGNSYQVFPTIMELDPSAAAWTVASVNAAEFGVKEIA